MPPEQDPVIDDPKPVVVADPPGTFDDGDDDVALAPEGGAPAAEAEPAPAADPVDPGTDPQVAAADPAPGEDGPKDPAGFTKAINKKHFEFKEQERRALAAEAEVQRLQQQLPQDQRPVIPDVPDPYDSDYQEQMEARDKKVLEAAQYDANLAAWQAQQNAAQQTAARERQEAMVKSVGTYSARAEKLGISAEDLQLAGNTIASYGISNELTQHILEDDQGPLITSFLARNPLELDKINAMPLLHAGIHIANVIKPQAIARSGVSSAPAPVDSLSGGGAPPSERGPKGATYE